MAKMIPENQTRDDFNDSLGEARVYEALSTLPERYLVFHSVKWNQKRVNGKVQWGESDFLVYDPTRGILVIEVKSGGISCEDGCWYQTNMRTGEKNQLKKSPMDQANYSKYTFLNLLSESENPNVRNCWVEPLVWFTSVSDRSTIGKMPNEFHDENVFIQDSFKDVEKNIDKAFDFYGIPPKAYRVPQSEIDEIVNIIAPNFNVFPNLASEADEHDFAFNRMTKEQSYLLDYLEEQSTAVIQGGGGTGKTMLAIEKARRLSKDEDVLFLCFNRMLLDFLRENYGEELPRVHFYNLQGLYCDLVEDVDKVENDDVSRMLNNYDQYDWKFKNIIVDEGQDFDNEHLEILSTIAKLQNGAFYVFFDKNQMIQQFDTPVWLENAECRLVLTRNCRNTFDIARTAYSIMGIENIKMNYNIEGEKPTLTFAEDGDNTIEKISEAIRHFKEQGFQKNQITILTMKTDQKSILHDKMSVGNYKISRNSADNEILFTTVRKFKGMESDVIIVVDFDESVFKKNMSKKLFYVAASRAKNFLHIVATMNREEIESAVYELCGEKRKNPKLVIASELRVKIVNSLG